MQARIQGKEKILRKKFFTKDFLFFNFYGQNQSVY